MLPFYSNILFRKDTTSIPETWDVGFIVVVKVEVFA